MTRFHLTLAALLCSVLVCAQEPSQTLRLDYIFSGNSSSAQISLDKMSSTDGWYGRRVNMDKLPVAGNGDIRLEDVKNGKTLYTNSFSTLFQEWQMTPQAKVCNKAFENTFLVPMPMDSARVTIKLYDFRGHTVCSMSHIVDPKDILIRHKNASPVQTNYIHKGGNCEHCIDIVILAEGYTAKQMDTFMEDASHAVKAILSHEPFKSMSSKLNFLAVAAPSHDEGVSVPREGLWCNTAVASHFDTFYIERYLTTSSIFKMHDLLDGLPYEHLVILANTKTYGGGGIYNSYTLTTAHHPMFAPVVVHEFGHSFGALADEYDYAGDEDPYYVPDVEPWEQNITTQHDFSCKWQDMMGKADTTNNAGPVGLYEGAGYQSKGVWRPCKDCRMRTNKAPGFCPVCQRAISKMILFNTEEE